MIDPATLPVTIGGNEISSGTTYEVKGLNFNMWPNNIVLAFSEYYAINAEYPWVGLMREVSRTDTTIIFVVDVAGSFSSNHTWQFFASPINNPREILQYKLL